MINPQKAYDPKIVEDKTYQLWEKSGYFNPDKLPKRHKKPFCIIMPPPNANGSLHIGHAVFVTLQDIMIRYKRMRGFKTLWLPGADHAGFETQVVYDKKLEKEGRSRFQIPREQLYKEMMDFTLKNKKTMESQLRKLGASCDWSREKFTLDPVITKITLQTYEKLKKDGLIYRGSRLVSWCIKHQTSLSDVEVKHITQKDPLYYIKYGPLWLATVRPETKFGDTGIAVNPRDPRYKKYIGCEIEIKTLLGPRKIKVIADSSIDMKFGTGVVKVTPAHDLADYEIWQRHKTEIPGPVSVIDKFGRLNKKAGPYAGLKIMEARKKIVEDMTRAGLLDPNKTDHNYQHNIAVCYKCGKPIEPLIFDNQIFVKMTAKPASGSKSLRDLGVSAVRSGKIKFIPKHFEKIFFHWMKNLRDWNISRQIVWGIPIPDSKTDVFDTWFSSGQWPFATLKTSGPHAFKTFYPTDVMETGWDILPFWVMRMIMLGMYITGKVPFKYVYLHGLVRDKERQKMSKSKGNVIDPLGVIDLFGTDSLRMALVVGNTPGNDPVIFEEKIRGYQHFANKIWNASRFVSMNLEKKYFNEKLKKIETGKIKLKAGDKKILHDLEKLKTLVSREMDKFKFYSASEKIYHYFWHIFCDKIIEAQKPRLKNLAERRVAQHLLFTILTTCLKMLHPFMPFVTETIWQELLKKRKSILMIEEWPD
jgi:valyl-tRNA synthetase